MQRLFHRGEAYFTEAATTIEAGKPRQLLNLGLFKRYKINAGEKNLMNRKDYLIAKKLKEKLSEVAIVENLTVFGSRAKGNADEYSDLDVSIVVASLNKELKEKILDIVWEVGFDNLVVISPIIFTIDEIENSPLRSAPIVKNILEEGVRI